MDFALAKIARWAFLPEEFVTFTTYGQPSLFPGQVITCYDSRTLGYAPIRYVVTRITSEWRANGSYFSTITGRYTNTGAYPGLN